MTSQTGVTAVKPAQFSPRDGRGTARPRIYMLHPLLAGPLSDWGRWLDGAAALGFTHVLTAPLFAGPSLLLAEDFDRAHPALGGSGSAEDGLRFFAEACRERGIERGRTQRAGHSRGGCGLASGRPAAVGGGRPPAARGDAGGARP